MDKKESGGMSLGEKEREAAFGVLTALIAFLAIWAFNLFGMQALGIWGGALAMCATLVGMALFAGVEGEFDAGKAAVLVFVAAVLAYFAATVPVFGGFYFFRLGFLFLLFSLVAPLSRSIRGRLLGK